ncbi:MAG: SGNH/GDSL hydrolase family protein [Planctomycetota bacterium]
MIGDLNGIRRRRVIGRWGLAVGSVVLSLLAIELAFRVWVQPQETLLVKDPLVGQRYRSGYQARYYVDESGRAIDLRFNQDGFRGPDRPREKSPDVSRVAILGDSFIAGIAVDESETLVSRLGRALQDVESARRWECFNFGVSGNGTGQSLLTWRNIAKRYAPDVVILCFYNGNDLADNHPSISSAHRPTFDIGVNGDLEVHPMSPTWTRLSRWLSDHSLFYEWQKNKMRVVRDRMRQTLGIVPPGMHIFDSRPKAPFDEAWLVTERLIVQLAQEVQATGAEFLLVSIPCHEQLDDAAWRELLVFAGSDAERFDRSFPETKLGSLCSKHEIRFLSLRGAMDRGAKSGEVFLPNRGHWTALGHQVAAEAIEHALKPERLHAN